MIHPTAVIAPSAELAENVDIGPFAVVDAGVKIGAGSRIGPRAYITGATEIGAEVEIHAGAVVGASPQARHGGKSRLVIRDRAVLREYCTVNVGTDDGVTWIGEDVLLMAYVHVAHDCWVGDGATLANRVQLGGHVHIGHRAVLGGCGAVHQFCRIGALSFVGGTLKIDRDIPPGSKILGNPARWAGLNHLGLERAGVSLETLDWLQLQYRTLRKTPWHQWLADQMDSLEDPLGLIAFAKNRTAELIAIGRVF